jgi:rhodanese-related sulfurtransferase
VADDQGGQAPEVGLDELDRALAEGEPVIDVREVDEYLTVHVPGVRLIPLSELNARAEEIPRDRRVYVVCASGGRSMAAATAMVRAGYDAVSVVGGTKAWLDSGRAVESSAGSETGAGRSEPSGSP